MTIETLRSSIQVETGHHPSAQHLYHNGQLVNDNSKTLSELGITHGDMLALHVREMRGSTALAASGRSPQQAPPPPRGGRPSGMEQDPEVIRLQVLGDPNLRAELRRARPELAAALEDPQGFAQLLYESHDRERRERAERHRQIQLLNADPFDPEAQAKIEEIIRQERVMENLQSAMEHNPEVFGNVHMLYLEVEVNGYKVKALVDSGAQATIMSPTCAEACGIMRLVDKRFAGVARGVGTANIIGRVHSAPIKIGPLFLPCSFTVMEGKQVELLLGLDMLKRHQACLDLAKDKLIIQGVEVPFLGPADIPKESDEAWQKEPTVPGPAGTTIGQRSGAVTAPSGSGAAAPSSGATPQAGSSAAASAASPGPRFPREHIEQLMALGASEYRAIQALEATGGNVEYAASLIFQD
ncbi:DNA damage-inducible protein 1 [Madurella mycetomatis]|uniref:DNA damage-inducible protein 1 n=1 Tax=Madurella mycetomatis TaxID=100816 RepID=A0A175W132_9PEZI|nr:DNA damage-inducible protein 1 [Madurella mycetomatis]